MKSGMDNKFIDFAKWSTRSPLGIIALFIVLVYLIAGLVTGLSGVFGPVDRHVLVWFLVTFPVLVLGVFTWLVIAHHTKLYGPADFRQDDGWLRANGLAELVEQVVALDRADDKDRASDKNRPPRADPNIAAIVEAVASGLRRDQRRDQKLLWVDDRLNKNVWERLAFESQGVTVVQCQTTDEALGLSAETSFAAIISDMERPEGNRAGIELLQLLRERGDRTPFFVYTHSLELRDEAMALGAKGLTTDPKSLLLMVNRSL